jgi:hypothetical protein
MTQAVVQTDWGWGRFGSERSWCTRAQNQPLLSTEKGRVVPHLDPVTAGL